MTNKKVDVRTPDGKKDGTVELPAALFDVEPNIALMHQVVVAQLAAKAGLPLNMDSWDGYPAARDRLLAAAQRADADLVTLSGDSHNVLYRFAVSHAGHCLVDGRAAVVLDAVVANVQGRQ